MPRVRQGTPQTGGTSKLKQCLQALVTDPEAACLGGNEFCCTGCGGNSDLVDSLCAFCLHSDAARNYFALNGGLDALLIAGRNSQSEKTILASLQVLQCLCSSKVGQALVVLHKPELLQMVCDQALDHDEDREGVQHAALTILTGWASADADPQLQSWFTHCPAIKQEQPPQQPIAPPPGHALVFGSGAVLPFPSVVLPSSSPTLSTPINPTPSSAPQSTLPSSNCMSISEPAMLHIASRALQHAALAVRRAAAQLFAVASAQGSDPSAPAAAICRLDTLSREVQDLLKSENQSINAPRFTAFANGRSQLMLDPMAFLKHQEHVARQKQACHALMHLMCELAARKAACQTVLAQCSGCLQVMLSVFEAAWQVGDAKLQSSSGVGLLPNDVPCSFLQDHQSRELALDAVVVVLKQPGMLACLGHALDPAQAPVHGSQFQQPPADPVGAVPAQPEAATPAPSSNAIQDHSNGLAAEERALQRLLQSVRSLLEQQSAGHIRAALTLIGHVRFDHPVVLPGVIANGDAVTHQAGSAVAHREWMQVLCDLFDATWEREQGSSMAQGSGEQDHDTDRVAANGGHKQQPGTNAVAPNNGIGSAAAATAARHRSAMFNLDVGLGYRVLVQVLHSWKVLLDMGTPAIRYELNCCGYMQRVALSLSHPKPMVVTAALKVYHHGTPKANQHVPQGSGTLDGVAGLVGMSDVSTWEDWGAWNGLEGGQLGNEGGDGGAMVGALEGLEPALGPQDDAFMAVAAAALGLDPWYQGAQGSGTGQGLDGHMSMPEVDQDMQEFLSVFLDGEGPQPDTPIINATANAPTLPTNTIDTTPAVGSPAITIDLSSASGTRPRTDIQAGLFSAWGTAGVGPAGPQTMGLEAKGAGQVDVEELIADALQLLPDLEHLNKNLMIKQDVSGAGLLSMLNRRPGAAMASPLAMLNL